MKSGVVAAAVTGGGDFKTAAEGSGSYNIL
jgi:hypothetical protein